MNEAKRNPFVEFWDSPWFGIGIGMVIGAFGSLLSVKWLIFAGWLFICIQIFRHDFVRRGTVLRILANTLASGIFAVAFIFSWHVIPKPPEPTSKRDIQDAVTAAFSAASQNGPPPAQSGSENPRKNEITQMVKEAIAAATDPSALSNLTNERLDEVTKYTIKQLLGYRDGWTDTYVAIAQGTRETINDSQPPLTKEQRDEERKKGEQALIELDNRMRAENKDIFQRACDLRAEIVKNRLEIREKAEMKAEDQASSIYFTKLKSGNYTPGDLNGATEHLRVLESKLATHTAPLN